MNRLFSEKIRCAESICSALPLPLGLWHDVHPLSPGPRGRCTNHVPAIPSLVLPQVLDYLWSGELAGCLPADAAAAAAARARVDVLKGWD